MKIKSIIEKILDEAKLKHIDIWFTDRGRFYRTVIDGKKRVKGWDGWSDSSKSLSRLLKWDINLRSMDHIELGKAEKQLKKQGIKLTWDDAMDVS